MIARDIIVIGASAGGIHAMRRLAAALPPDLQAAVFLTIHLSERSNSVLTEVLNRSGPLHASYPWEETPIQQGEIYVAPPDYHLLLTQDKVHLGHGPKENLQRPCINAMFRSAAASHGQRVIGVLLTGLLDDGAAGLWEIQQRGGVTVVQDPNDAAYRSMPESAIRGLNVQYIVPLADIPPLLTRLTMGDRNLFTPPEPAPATEELIAQACPECGGVMTMARLGKLREYICHVGHRFGVKTMIAEKSGKVERAIWTALSQSEELTVLLEQARPEMDNETITALSEEIALRKREQQTLRNLIERIRAPTLKSDTQ